MNCSFVESLNNNLAKSLVIDNENIINLVDCTFIYESLDINEYTPFIYLFELNTLFVINSTFFYTKDFIKGVFIQTSNK